MSDQLMFFIESAAENMTSDALLEFAEDALNRIKSNQEDNNYVQYQAEIVKTILKEVRDRVDGY